MTVSVSGKHVEVGDSLREHIQTHLVALVSKHMGEELESSVTVSKEGQNFKVDMNVHISKNFSATCQGVDPDAYKAADSALARLDTRIKKYKDRLRDRKRHDSDYHALPVSYSVIDSSEGEDKGAPVIIAERAQDISTLSVSDAVMKLDLTDQPLLLFTNAANGQLNVIYKRMDGNIGWIDPSRKVS